MNAGLKKFTTPNAAKWVRIKLLSQLLDNFMIVAYQDCR